MAKNPYDPRSLGIAAGSSTDPLNLGLSDRGARDFKDGLTSIERTSKEGGFNDLMDMFKSMSDVFTSPFIKDITDLFRVFRQFIDAGGAEAAIKLRQELLNPDTIKAMEMFSNDWRNISNALVDGLINTKNAVGGIAYELGVQTYNMQQGFILLATTVKNGFMNMGEKILDWVWDGMNDAKDAFKNAIEKFFEDLL